MSKLTWDPDNPRERAAAQLIFHLLKREGLSSYDANGKLIKSSKKCSEAHFKPKPSLLCRLIDRITVTPQETSDDADV